MSQPTRKKISELDQITSGQVAETDILLVTKTSPNRSRGITVEEMDKRWDQTQDIEDLEETVDLQALELVEIAEEIEGVEDRVGDAETAITALQTNKADQTDLDNHINATSSIHGVTTPLTVDSAQTLSNKTFSDTPVIESGLDFLEGSVSGTIPAGRSVLFVNTLSRPVLRTGSTDRNLAFQDEIILSRVDNTIENDQTTPEDLGVSLGSDEGFYIDYFVRRHFVIDPDPTVVDSFEEVGRLHGYFVDGVPVLDEAYPPLGDAGITFSLDGNDLKYTTTDLTSMGSTQSLGEIVMIIAEM